MEMIKELITLFIANLDIVNLTVGGVLGALILIAYFKWTPNKYVYQTFFGLGKKLSKKAGQKLGKQNWEKIENSLVGTVTAAAKGFEDGANSDDDTESD